MADQTTIIKLDPELLALVSRYVDAVQIGMFAADHDALRNITRSSKQLLEKANRISTNPPKGETK